MSDVDVSFGADISEAVSGFNQLTREMRDAFRDMATGSRGDVERLERELRDLRQEINKTKNDAKGMGSLFGGIGGKIAGLAAGFGLMQVAQETVSTITEFERLRAVLETLEPGSSDARFESLKQFAKETPFDLQQVVTAFSKLKAQGLDPGAEAMRAYGNIAAGMGKSLDQFIEAVADSVMGENERLKEFGIKAQQHGDMVTFTFKGVSTTVKREAGAIQQYMQSIGNTEFAGAMDRQMKTLGGAFSNLGDTVASTMDEIGKGGLSEAISQIVTDMSAATSESGNWAEMLGGVLGTTLLEVWEIVKTFGQVTGDVLSTVADIFRSFTGSTQSNGDLIIDVFKAIEGTLVFFGFLIKETFTIAGGIVRAAAVTIQGNLRAINAALHFDFKGYVDAMNQWRTQVVDIATDTANKVAEEARRTDAKLKEISGRQVGAQPATPTAPLPAYTPPRASPSIGSGGGGGSGGRSRGGGSAAPAREQNRAGDWRDELDQQKRAQLGFFEDSTQMELDFWRQKLTIARAGSQEYQDVAEAIYNLERRVASEAGKIAEERIAHNQSMANAIADNENELAQIRIDRERETLRAQNDMGVISRSEYLSRMQQLDQQELQDQASHENQLYTIKYQALQDQLALESLAPDERRRVLNELEQLEVEHQGRMAQIRARTEAATAAAQNENARAVKERWMGIISPVGQAFDGFLQSMWTRSASFGQALLQMGDQIVGSFISMGVQMLTQWVANELAKTAATTAGVATRTSVEAAGAATSTSISAGSAIAQVAHNAIKAATGAYAAIASIPVVGPFLAPAVAAAALYGVYRLGKGIFSAEGGWGEVPHDGAQAVLHKQEMVLPAKFANPLREMLTGAGPRVASLSGGAAATLADKTSGGTSSDPFASGSGSRSALPAIHYHATKGTTVAEMERNAGVLVKVMKNAIRNREFEFDT